MKQLLSRLAEGIHRQNFDRFAEHALSALPGPFLPWSRFAMRPGGILAVLNDVWLHDRQTIVECGAGISTVYTGRLLKQRGYGALVSIEHDELWFSRLRQVVDAEELPVTVVHAPLTVRAHGAWYDTSRIPRQDEVDLLVVDGPPANHRAIREARYPALPHFAPVLVPGATVILDDILRRGETIVADRWEREFGLTMERRRIEGAVAIGSFPPRTRTS